MYITFIFYKCCVCPAFDERGILTRDAKQIILLILKAIILKYRSIYAHLYNKQKSDADIMEIGEMHLFFSFFSFFFLHHFQIVLSCNYLYSFLCTLPRFFHGIFNFKTSILEADLFQCCIACFPIFCETNI